MELIICNLLLKTEYMIAMVLRVQLLHQNFLCHYICCIRHQMGENMTNNIKQIGNIVKTGNFKNPQRGRIYSIRCDEGLRTFQNGNIGTIRTIDAGGGIKE